MQAPLLFNLLDNFLSSHLLSNSFVAYEYNRFDQCDRHYELRRYRLFPTTRQPLGNLIHHFRLFLQ